MWTKEVSFPLAILPLLSTQVDGRLFHLSHAPPTATLESRVHDVKTDSPERALLTRSLPSPSSPPR